MTVEALVGPDERLPDEANGAPTSNAAVTTIGTAATNDVLFADPGADRDADRAIGVRMIDGGIIEVLIPPNQEIEGPEARVAGDAVRALAAGRRMPVLLVITGVVGVSVEARQVYTGSIAATAFALVGESPVDRVIAHYLLRSRSETIPAQFFSSESAAVEWLRQFAREE
ncbi:hypothetical protein [Arthrobacter sp. NicSoilB8]|uniref:DUF7793 family protein n=1 Tax=Arthrobacter sp. NicSoilB8 TaxID=2830998 RepID=UPI001CC65703|nr:hypothetical protein [Arthrobacter sp. NicSoilB8]BCW69791.1 hypothetical protein NicSoilB8_08350 [Arthrobacter sp. NicSoilB8]